MRLRRTMMALILALALSCVLPRAAAVSGGGVIKGGHLATVTLGVTEGEFRHTRNCSSIPQTQGLDGLIIDLQGATHLNMTTTTSLPAPHSIVTLFLSTSCVRVGQLYGGIDGTTSYAGAIPSLNLVPARWAVVNAVYGADINVAYQTTTP